MKKIYRFKISLLEGVGESYGARDFVRKLEICGEGSLFELADAITFCYDFKFDHAFAFYDDMAALDQYNPKYSLFADMENIEESVGKSVKKTKISSAFEKSKKMFFMFDFGDEWVFQIKCIDIFDEEKGVDYPAMIYQEGEAPKQYSEFF